MGGCKDDIGTVYGNNICQIRNNCNVNANCLLTSQLVKTTMSYFDTPDNEIWRLPIIKEILDLKTNNLCLAGFSNDEMEDMLVFACTT